MQDASWAISALITAGFFILAGSASSGIRWAYLVMGILMIPITYVRYKAARRG